MLTQGRALALVLALDEEKTESRKEGRTDNHYMCSAELGRFECLGPGELSASSHCWRLYHSIHIQYCQV